MRPFIYLADKPTDKWFVFLHEHMNVVSDIKQAQYVYTQLSPVVTYLPVFCPCTDISHVYANDVTFLDQDFKDGVGRRVTSTAEHALLLMLLAARVHQIQLSGKLLGVIGRGRLGRHMVDYGHALGMSIITNDIGDDNLNYLLAKSDVISLHIPLEGNKDFLSYKELNLIKDNTILVNTSRPDVVNRRALAVNTQIRYVDDFLNERPLHEPRYFQTPHLGGKTKEARELTDEYIINKLLERISDDNGKV